MTFVLKIAVNTPFNRSVLSYLSPELIDRGVLVTVPLGRRYCLGCVLGQDEASLNSEDYQKLKTINASERAYPFKIESLELDFFSWIADYYHYPLGQLIADVLPKIMKRPKKLSDCLGENKPIEMELNVEQKTAWEKIQDKLGKGFQRFLLHGVTGSGKSLVYLKAIKRATEQGKSALFLLPEINLTPQFIAAFSQHLNCKVFVYNSSITGSEKFGLWKYLSESEEPCLVIGVRSAIFLPLKNLGIIIVDEEHDSSFKQEDRCPYNARDAAIKKAQLQKIPVILGSATPSIESYSQLRDTKNYLTIKNRAVSTQLPQIKLVNCKTSGNFDKQGEDSIWPYHPDGIASLKKALERQEQALVFLNKLGYADFLQCRSCGHHFSCPNCSSNLKFFKRRNEISCQICGFKDRSPEICPECGNMAIKQVGYGTEKLTEILKAQLPEARIERFDRDEISNFSQLEDKLRRFHDGDIDIFVGTQMLSKGHNFKKVNLVLVMGIDAQLNFPDYRSSERAYQLITQVSGRPGRFGENSEVLINTLNEENPLFKIIQNHEFDQFYEEELKLRELCDCPPYAKLAMIYVTSKSRELSMRESTKVAQLFETIKSQKLDAITVLGPRPSLIEKRVNKFTWSLMLRSADRNQLHNALKTLIKYFKPASGVSIKIDVDPYHLH